MAGDQPNNTKLLFIDLDGTLLNSRAELTPQSWRAVEQCTRAGISVVMATARPPRNSRPLYDRLRLETPSIHYNGALIYDFPTGTTLLHHPMPGRLAKELCERALEIDASAVVSLEVSDKWYMNRRPDHFITQTERMGFVPDYVGELAGCFEQPVTKVLISFPSAYIDEAEAILKNRLGARLTVTRSDEAALQVMDAGVSKGTAAEFLMNKFGVPREEAAAIGDAPNDVAMFDVVGLSVAMGNGYREVRAAADHVTLTNDEDGAAAAIRNFILNAKHEQRGSRRG